MINTTFIKQIERAANSQSSLVSGILPGGASGQVLAKSSSGDFDTVWVDPMTLSVSGVDISSLYPRSNPSGFITGVDTSNFYTNDNLSGFITGIANLVYTTGDQDISGRKSFPQGLDAGLQTDVTTLYVGSGVVGINTENPQGALDVSGSVLFNQRPTVNGSGVLLIDELQEQLNEKKMSLLLYSGMTYTGIAFTGKEFLSIPIVYCNIDGDNVIYQTLVKNKTISGCDIYFSDTIQEDNYYLNIHAFN